MRIRYRKPSLKTALGLTAAKKKAKRAVGWESESAKLFRFITGLFK